MGVVVDFNYQSFVQLFPELENVDEGTVEGWWDVAGNTICRNDGLGPVSKPKTQEYLLFFATAHLMLLFTPQVGGIPNTEDPTAAAPANLVGRINNATEGSVSVGTEMSGLTASSSWWNQTRYGAAWWQMTAPYRTMRYLPGPQRYFGPYAWSGATPWTQFYTGSQFVGLNGQVLF